jgi:hypothetical protein
VMVAILAVQLRNREPDFDLRGVSDVAWRALVASLVPAIPIALVAWVVRPPLDFGGQFVMLAASTLLGTTAYLVLSRALNIDEPWIALRSLLQWAQRRRSRRT